MEIILVASLTVCIREKQGQNDEHRHLTFLLKEALLFSVAQEIMGLGRGKMSICQPETSSSSAVNEALMSRSNGLAQFFKGKGLGHRCPKTVLTVSRHDRVIGVAASNNEFRLRI